MRKDAINMTSAESVLSALAMANVEVSPSSKRFYARTSYRAPVKVLDTLGRALYAVTEDISIGGFSFSSLRDYEIGADVFVEIFCDGKGQTIRARGSVVRREPSRGGWLYGVRYEKGPYEQ